MSRELPAVRPLHHHVEFDLAKFLARVCPVVRMPVTTARDLVPCRISSSWPSVTSPLRDQHPVELGADGHHVVGRWRAVRRLRRVIGRVDRRDFAVGK